MKEEQKHHKEEHGVLKNISKGFGLVIGGFIALFIIIASCSILLVKPVAEETQKINEQYKQEIIQPLKQVQKDIQKSQEELIGKEVKDVNPEILFSQSKAKATDKGITLSLDEFTIEKKEGWGKITYLKVTILNQGTNTIFPKVLVRLWDEKTDLETKYTVHETIETDGMIDNGNYKVISTPVNIGFQNIDLKKTIKLSLVDKFDWQAKNIVALEHTFNIQ